MYNVILIVTATVFTAYQKLSLKVRTRYSLWSGLMVHYWLEGQICMLPLHQIELQQLVIKLIRQSVKCNYFN